MNLIASKATVFVALEHSRFDYSDAERFGSIRFVAPRDYSPYQTSMDNDRLFINIDHCVNIYNPIQDYLLLTGGPITMGLVFHAFAKRASALNVNGVRCLQHVRDTNTYRQVIVRLK